MKKFKKLIPALCMLLVSAVMLGSTTFAWFSMNTTVTANGMQIEAKSNATYLLISKDPKVATDKTKAETTDTLAFTESATKVYPAKFSATEQKLSETVTVPTNGWYTANNGNSDHATNDVKNYKLVNEDNFTNYVKTYTMYLTLSEDSEDWVKYLKISTTAGATNKAAAIVIKVTNGTNSVYFDGGSGYVDCTTTALTHSSVIKVEAYVYIDGTNNEVYSNNTIADLKGDFSIQFDLTETNA